MTILRIGNRVSHVQEPSSLAVRVLEKACSYRVEGYMFSRAWREKVWDGREHLMKFSRRDGYTVPTGLAVTVARKLRSIGEKYTVKDETIIRSKRQPIEVVSNDPARDYQLEVVRATLKSTFPARGIIKMPVRSGKTRTASEIMGRLGLPALFGVPSLGLLHQSHKALSEYFPSYTIGRIGDGIYEPGYFTVATMQTLLKWRGRKAFTKNGKSHPAIERDSRYNDLMKAFDVTVFDECHRLKGQSSWHEVAYDFDARFKIGLSATAFLDNEDEQSRGAIWMIATCGPVIVDIPVSRLVEAGYLMRQHVEIYKVHSPDYRGAGWSTTMRKSCIDTNRARNSMIANLAKQHAAKKLRVLVIARHHEHMFHLVEELERRDLTVAVVKGSTTQSRREQVAEDLLDRSVDCVVSNVFGEGIDLPGIEVVINAEGGAGDIATVQRQRNLTISKGKKKAILIDFLDLTNETLEEHSQARIAMYESEPSFKVRVH